MDAEAMCVALIMEQLTDGTTSVATVGARVFGKENALVADAIRSSHGSFRAFVMQRPEFRVDESDNIRLVVVQRKTRHAKVKRETPVQPKSKSVEEECVSLICIEIERGEHDIGTVGGRVFKNSSLAEKIKAVHGSFRSFVQSRPEFIIKQTSTGVVILPSTGQVKKTPKAQSSQPKKQSKVAVVMEKKKENKSHRRKKSLQLESLEAPVPEPGEWVLTEDFKGRKSFGWFECGKCAKCWPSAHAFKEYTQGCQRCETAQGPKFMWQNYGRKRDDDDSSGGLDLDGPHDQDRCEACRHGDCVAGLLGSNNSVTTPVRYSYDEHEYDYHE